MTLVSPDLDGSSCFATAPFMALGFPEKQLEMKMVLFSSEKTGGLCPCPDVETRWLRPGLFLPKWTLTAENPGEQMLRHNQGSSAE